MRFNRVVRRAGWPLLIGFLLLGLTTYAVLSPARSAFAASSVAINGATHYQTMDGFGFSEGFGPAKSMETLPTSAQKQALDLLFNTTNGAGFSILRNLLPSDASHTIEPTSPGSPTATPTYVWDGDSWGQVWLAQQALSYGVKNIYLDAWSAPGFMKTNNDEANGGAVCGVPGATCSSGDWRQAYANYLVQYIKDYQSANVPVAEIGYVNEPDLQTTYSSMVMSPAQTADFAKVLAPTLKSAGLNQPVVCCEPEGWNLIQSYADAITGDATANADVNIISSHGYTAAPTFAVTGVGSKHVWETEWSKFDSWDPSWDSGGDASGFTWAQNVYTGLTSANLSAFLYWWGFSNGGTDNGFLYRYNSSSGTFDVSKRLWALANYSRFVRPGAVRIGSTSSDSNLHVTAFQNTDGSTSIVVLNNASTATPVSFSLQNLTLPTNAVAIPYVTDANNNTTQQGALAIQNSTLSATVGARSLVTYQITNGTGVTPIPTTPPATVTPTTPPVTPTTTPAGGCKVVYAVNQWQGGFTANVTITNTGTSAINGWTLKFTFPGNQQVTQGWNGVFSQAGANVTVTNASYNGALSPGGTVNPGFNGSWSGSNPSPTAFTLNGMSCSTS